MTRLKCVLWNVAWTSSRSVRGEHILRLVRAQKPDIICLTESLTTFGLGGGHTICSDADYGYKHNGTRRKVRLWSQVPWSDVDPVGSPDLPPGRFVSGVAEGVRFVGVCIPWSAAHVTSGRRDRSPWEEHVQYLRGIRNLLERYTTDGVPVCILGDFNQRIPCSNMSFRSRELELALTGQLVVATQGVRDTDGRALIDHVAVSRSLSATVDCTISRTTRDGTRLSDHPGVVCSVRPATRCVETTQP